MGMHWNSSGVTTTVLGALRNKLNPRAKDLGLYILGGKGKAIQGLNGQINRVSQTHDLDMKPLARSCRLARRIDGNAIQDGFDLYQQYFLLSDEGEWTAIQQGLNKDSRRARRYHWHSPEVRSFTSEPHKGIAGIEDQSILNLVDADAETLQQRHGYSDARETIRHR